MKVQRFEVAEELDLTIVCHSDLSVNGGREGELVIKAYGSEEDLEVQRDGNEFFITSRAGCKVACPRATALTLNQVSGDTRVRRISGAITAEHLSGDASLGDVGSIALNEVSGDARIRTADGDLELEKVFGDLRLRSVNGDIRFGQVSGDVSARGVQGSLSGTGVSGDLSVRGVAGLVACDSVSGSVDAAFLDGGLEVSASGNASLKTDLASGCTYNIAAHGNVAVTLPIHANARFEIDSSSKINHNVDFDEIEEASRNRLVGRIGDGEASVSIKASGAVSLRCKSEAEDFIFGFEPSEEEELGLELESMAEEIERNIEAHMARLNAQLEQELSRIDHTALHLKSEKAAIRAAEKARRKAEHAAERTRIKAERAQRRWERVGSVRPAPPSPPASQRRQADPITEEERLMILEMVKDGKITSSEAASLLEALEG
jgi:DUF4097 and DUF4098 domain-containing protein YvlB